ncbi:helicase-related protein [Aestuariivivens sediminicola]|uniref:helicase-related protein n=1 Tax=Aestuariivivens sediminicola TaxID=2913560 RepID=UPI001F562D80|nr:helicase-related protein [Aestuariivivens sediminicola]
MDFYTTGILYPQSTSESSFFDDDQPNNDDKYNDVEINGETGTGNPSNKNTYNKKVIEDDTEEDLRLTTEFYPSSIAISSIVDESDNLEVSINCGKYYPSSNQIKEELGAKFSRLNIDCIFNYNVASGNLNGEIQSEHIWETNGQGNIISLTNTDLSVQIKIIKRKQYGLSGNHSIITVSLINCNTKKGGSRKSLEGCLFQPRISLYSDNSFLPFPDNTKLQFLNEEEIELKFLYRHYKSYGLGHGCACDWNNEDQLVKSVHSAIIPTEKINGVNFSPTELEGVDDILFMKRLTDLRIDFDREKLKRELSNFVSVYSDWIGGQEEKLKREKMVPEFEKASYSIISKCKKLLERMDKGISLLDDNKVLRAFLDANRAMFMQRVMGDFSKHRQQENRNIPDAGNSENDDGIPHFSKIPYDSISGSLWKDGKLNIPSEPVKGNRYLAKWRPFQLAFLLSQIEGIVDPNSEDRSTVDLLWFPTGGGKTEAYLGLIAFTVFYRRMTTEFDSQGVSVMMRYTLRMLNKQQFDRANILICSCEIIRSENVELYGQTRISNGLWVGGSYFPNKHKGYREYKGNNELLLDYIADIEKKNSSNTRYSPPVFNCPCCGNKLVKEVHLDTNKKPIVIGEWGYSQKINKFRGKPFNHDKSNYNPYYLHCTNSKCHFYLSKDDFRLTKNESEIISQRCLPIYYVDEDIYLHRPTLLFSTIDKYAQLAWRNEAFRLFNYDSDFNLICSPPSLIVQDELHLISSSLGTIYSLFEFAVDELSDNNGVKPKIIGATATVRNAEQQCIKIYNRERYTQFPPVGIDIDDSFYSRKKEKDPDGRLYVGIMPSGNTSTTAKLRLDSLLYEGINCISGVENKVLDNYYTLLAYFNTVKELGKYRTLLEDDMVAYRKFLTNHLHNIYIGYNPDRIAELSSQMTADQINTTLDDLENVRLHKTNIHSNCVKFLSEIGINSIKDLEQSKYNKWRWIPIMVNRWGTMKELCGLDEGLRIDGYPLDDDKKQKFQEAFDIFFHIFKGALKESIDGDVKDPIKVAMSTNMISVGVDIPRLNVMSISGQPKTTAEYIQASSRVGREVPGIVFTLYNQAKNRDRSHYENFKDYHQAYYKYVESTSVTPFSLPALEKTLDSVVIALMKAFHYKGESNAFLDSEAKVQLDTIRSKMLKRYTGINSALSNSNFEVIERKKHEINLLFDDIIDRWEKLGGVDFTEFRDIMKYPLSEENLNSKLFMDAKFRDHQMTKGMLFAMTSLRDVDTSSIMKIKSYID